MVAASGVARLTSRRVAAQHRALVARAVQLDPQRQPGLRVGPDVDLGDAGGRARPGEAYAGARRSRPPVGPAAGTAPRRVRPAASAGPASAAAGRRRRAAGSPRPGRSSRARTRRPSGSCSARGGTGRSRRCCGSGRSASRRRRATRPAGRCPRRAAGPDRRTSRCPAPARLPEVSTQPGPGGAAEAWIGGPGGGLTPGSAAGRA